MTIRRTTTDRRSVAVPAVGLAALHSATETAESPSTSRRFVITSQACSVLEVFLADPETPRYGLELMKLTGLSSGTVYPVIYRFERAGWLTATAEPVDPNKEGRRRRRAFKITQEGIQGARMARAELHHQSALHSDAQHQSIRPGIAPMPGYAAGSTG